MSDMPDEIWARTYFRQSYWIDHEPAVAEIGKAAWTRYTRTDLVAADTARRDELIERTKTMPPQSNLNPELAQWTFDVIEYLRERGDTPRCEWCAPEFSCFDGSKPCAKVERGDTK